MKTYAHIDRRTNARFYTASKRTETQMSLFRTIDDYLIDKVFQPAADWWTDRTGKSNFWLAKVSFWGALVCFSAMFVFISGQSWLMFLLFTLFGFWVLFQIHEMEQLDRNAQSGKTLAANSMRIDPSHFFIRNAIFVMMIVGFLLRIPMMLLLGFEWKYALHLLDDVFWLGLLYFPACTPKPPRPVRVTAPDVAHSYT